MNVGIPPRSRNQRLPAASDAPTASAASSLLKPLTISRQNSRSISRRSDGFPGDFIGDLPVSSRIHPAGLPINTPTIKALRQPVESAESLSFYKTLFPTYNMGVEEQVTEGNRVASRWVLKGTYHGRAVTLRGITISRLDEDGRTVEDRGHSDSIALLGQIGVIRTLILGLEILTRRVKLPKGVLRAGG